MNELLSKWLREYADEMEEEIPDLSTPCLFMIGFAREAAHEIDQLQSENRRLKSLVQNPRSRPCPTLLPVSTSIGATTDTTGGHPTCSATTEATSVQSAESQPTSSKR